MSQQTLPLPVLFVGHGSPMNAIEDNRYSRGMKAMGQLLSKRYGQPKAILAVSAHWTTHGIKVSDALKNHQVNDMYGFPPELYAVQYEPAGAPDVARESVRLLNDASRPEGDDARSGAPRKTAQANKPAAIDNSWGIDHGVWSVLTNLYPGAQVPVAMMSVDPSLPFSALYQAGQALAPVRREGVLILASGNVVHNLALARPMNGGYDWAQRFDADMRRAIERGDHACVLDASTHPDCRRAFFTPEHFDPLPVALGAAGKSAHVQVWNEGCDGGAVSMTSYLFE